MREKASPVRLLPCTRLKPFAKELAFNSFARHLERHHKVQKQDDKPHACSGKIIAIARANLMQIR